MNSVKFRKTLHNNKILLIIAGIVILFPVVVGLIYAIPIRQIILIDAGDLLSYYATTFGIIGSFVTYQHEKQKKEKERINGLKPFFCVEVQKDENNNEEFLLKITKQSDNNLSFMYLYDEFVAEIVEEKFSFRVAYNLSVEDSQKKGIKYNFTMDDDIIDSDGYPKFVQILCDDIDGNAWNCCYNKISNGETRYYYPREIEIL